MRLKEYVSPEFQWMSVTLIEDSLTPSNPDYPETGDDYDDIFGDGESAEEDVNEATSPDDFDWDNW